MGVLLTGALKVPVKVSELTQPATVSAAAVTGPCAFMGIVLQTNGTNDITLNIYDNDEASGNKLIPTDTVIEGNPKRLWSLAYDPGIRCVTGVYVDVDGTLGSYQVQYDQG